MNKQDFRKHSGNIETYFQMCKQVFCVHKYFFVYVPHSSADMEMFKNKIPSLCSCPDYKTDRGLLWDLPRSERKVSKTQERNRFGYLTACPATVVENFLPWQTTVVANLGGTHLAAAGIYIL